MQFAAKRSKRRLARPAVALAAISALFAFAAPAKAETIDGIAAAASRVTEAASDPVGEVPISAESAAAPVEAAEPVEAPETTGASDLVGAAVNSNPVPSSLDPIPAADSVLASTPAPSDAVPVKAALDAVSAPVPEITRPVHAAVKPDAAVPQPVHRVSELVGGIAGDSSQGIALIVDIERAVQSVQAHAPLLNVKDDALPSIAIDQLPPVSGETPSASAHGVPSAGAPSFSGPLLTALPLRDRADGPAGLLAKYMTGFGDAGSSRLLAPGSLSASAGQPSPTVTPSSSAAVQHSSRPTPVDGPGPLPGSPRAAVPGSGASFFVPLAALLALLALVAPAIIRRLREVPDFPAPTPFVCALERPG